MPWYSFFTWGWKAPRRMVARFWYEGKEYLAPTAMVDLAKPAFKLGVAAIRVGIAAHELAGQRHDRQAAVHGAQQGARQDQGRLPGGKPAAGAEVAFAAVDEGAARAAPNDRWNLLDAMMQRRAGASRPRPRRCEIIGRRHYGRKAVAAGGGGGRGADARAVRHPAAVEAGRRARRQRRGDGRGAAQRFADELSHRRGRRRRRQQVRHRQHEHPRHAGPADPRRPAAAGARRRSLRGAAHAAQHDGARDEGRASTLQGTANLPGAAVGEIARVPIAPAGAGRRRRCRRREGGRLADRRACGRVSITWEASAEEASAKDD